MRNAITLVSSIALVGLPHAGAPEAVQPAKHSVVALKVSGMQCQICARAVERTAKELAGVIAATANQPKGTADITYDPAKTSPEEIARSLASKSGFKAELRKPRK